MIDELSKIIRIKVLLVSFVLFLIISVIFSLAVLCFARLRSNAIATHQYSLYGVLKQDADASQELVPSRYSPVLVSEREYYLKEVDTYYYRDAWDKPGRVLLKKRWGKFYYLTFGDGSRAMVTYWSPHGTVDPNLKPCYIQATSAERCNYVKFWLIPLGLITIAITLLVEHKIERKCERGARASVGA